MEKLRKAFGACLVPLLSILLAFLVGGIIMAALGADPFVAVKFLFQGAFRHEGRYRHDTYKSNAADVYRALCVLRV